MHCKSLWIKASAKCINVNVNVNEDFHTIQIAIAHKLDACLFLVFYIIKYIPWYDYAVSYQ